MSGSRRMTQFGARARTDAHLTQIRAERKIRIERGPDLP